jgi:hypothetical protein
MFSPDVETVLKNAPALDEPRLRALLAQEREAGAIVTVNRRRSGSISIKMPIAVSMPGAATAYLNVRPKNAQANLRLDGLPAGTVYAFLREVQPSNKRKVAIRLASEQALQEALKLAEQARKAA